MSFEAVAAVLEHSDAREAARLVLICLAERADENRQCYPSIRDIASRARLSERVVPRILDRLVEAGEIVRLYRIGISASYIVTAGLTPEQIEAYTKRAWGKTMRQVVATNREIEGRIKRSRGNATTALGAAKTLPLTVEGSPPFHSQWKGTLPPTVEGDPSTHSGSEPSYNHQYNHHLRAENPRAGGQTSLSPVEHAFERATREKSPADVIRSWRGASHLIDLCIAFQAAFGVPVVKADAGRWLRGAQDLYELRPTQDELRAAASLAEARGLSIVHPSAAYNLVKMLRQQAAQKAACANGTAGGRIASGPVRVWREKHAPA